MKRKDFPNEKIVQVYEKKACNLSATAAALGLGRRTLIQWRDKDPKLAEAMADVEESLIDFSESKLLEQINVGNLTAIIFHLKTKGKKRGYVEKTEQDITVNPFEKLMMELPDEIED